MKVTPTIVIEHKTEDGNLEAHVWGEPAAVYWIDDAADLAFWLRQLRREFPTVAFRIAKSAESFRERLGLPAQLAEPNTKQTTEK